MSKLAAGDQKRSADLWQVHSGVLEGWIRNLCDLTVERILLNAILDR